MPAKNIVLCFPAEERHIAEIRTATGDYQVIHASQSEIAQRLFDADIFYGHAKVPVDWPAVVEQGRLRWIQSSAAGLDHCLHPSVIESDIVVSGCSALFADQVAEQTMAILFGLIRSMPAFHAAQGKREYNRLPTGLLHGKTIGIVGFGGNGRRIASALQTFAGKIIATDCFPEFESPSYVEVRPNASLESLFAESDVIIATLPLSDANEQLIGAAEFAACKKGAYFVNVGRGSVVDHDALCRALKSGKLAGAGLDVFDPEPIPTDHPIWAFQNVIITPHVGAQSPYRVDSSTRLFCENFSRYHAGETLLNLVDKQLGFPRPEHRVRNF